MFRHRIRRPVNKYLRATLFSSEKKQTCDQWKLAQGISSARKFSSSGMIITIRSQNDDGYETDFWEKKGRRREGRQG